MKKLTSLFCLAAFALAPTGVATAQESTTTEANVLQLSDAYGSSNTEYVLTVKLENSAEVRDLCFDVAVPEGLSVTGMQFADFSSVSSYNLKMNDAKTRAIMYSASGSIFAADFGSPIVNITLGKEDGVDFEEKTIELNNVEISTSLLSATSLVQTANTASYTVPAAVADVNGIVYAGTSEGQTKSLAEFMLIQETAPNAIMIVDGAYADEIQGVKNVVFEYANDGVKTYVCRELVLTDKENFYSPVDFVAKSGSYTRTVSTRNSTACFPFPIATTDLPEGYKILTFAYFQRINSVEGDQGYVFFNTNNDIKAGVPCFLFSENPSDWNFTFNNSTIVSTPENSGGLKGAFVETDLAQYQPCYRPSINDDKLSKASAAIKPFRCVLSLKYDVLFNGDDSETTEGQAPERLKMFIIDDEANGIETLKMDNDERVIYNINGQRLMNADKAGFYIINGKKVIKK